MIITKKKDRKRFIVHRFTVDNVLYKIDNYQLYCSVFKQYAIEQLIEALHYIDKNNITKISTITNYIKEFDNTINFNEHGNLEVSVCRKTFTLNQDETLELIKQLTKV